MKTYTRSQIDKGMNNLFSVVNDGEVTIQGINFLQFIGGDDSFRIIVDTRNGNFSGYNLESKEMLPPHGQIQSIKGM